MKKLLTLSLVGLMMLAASASATRTRTYTLGQTNNILLDEDNIFLYPSRINMYPNVAVADIGDLINYDQYDYYSVGSFGIHWKFNEKNPWVLGTYFSNAGEQYSNDGLGLSNTFLPLDYWMPYLDWVPELGSNKRFTLVYGRKLGSNYFGFSFNKVQRSYKDETAAPNNDGKEGIGAYDFGFSLTDANGKWDIAAGLNLLSFSDMVDETNHDWKSKGNKSFYGYGRMFHQVNPQWTLVPNAGIVIGKFEADRYDYEVSPEVLEYTEKYTSFTFWGGLGAHYTPAPNMLAVGEVGFGYNSTKFTHTVPAAPTTNYDYKDTYLTFPYFKLGVEGKMFDWMDLRFGATSNWHRETWETTNYYLTALPTKEKYNYPDNQTYFGTGLHFGNFHIDTYTSPEILLKGFYFISGNASNDNSDDLNFHVSVLYDFK